MGTNSRITSATMAVVAKSAVMAEPQFVCSVYGCYHTGHHYCGGNSTFSWPPDNNARITALEARVAALRPNSAANSQPTCD